MTICSGMIRSLNSSDEWQIIGITYDTGCKSSLISVYTISHFKTTIYTPYIARVNRVKTIRLFL